MINKNKIIEEAEFGLDSRYKLKDEEKSEAKSLMQARLHRMKNLSKEEIIQDKLMQQKSKKSL